MSQKEELKADNEWIARFMGYKTREIKTYFDEIEVVWYKDDPLSWHGLPNFDENWNLFMRAYSKFSALEYDENKLNDEHANHCASIAEKVLSFDIIGACEKLVEGIKWYNKEKSNLK